MGSSEYVDEKPVHEVVINYDFEISKYPVTVGEFRAFVEDTGYKTEAEIGDGSYIWDGKNVSLKKDAYWDNPYFEQTNKHPVVCISWNDANKYIKWLNKKTGENYRLPTEAEWEYSCKAGTITKWNFGDDENELTKYAWYYENSYNKTHPVGKKLQNLWELYDMYGNIWEATISDYLKGGSWGSPIYRISSTLLNNRANFHCDNKMGFRIAKTVISNNKVIPLAGNLLLCLKDSDIKFATEIAKLYIEQDFKILSTREVKRNLSENNIESELVLRSNEGRPNLHDMIKNSEILIAICNENDKIYIEETLSYVDIVYI